MRESRKTERMHLPSDTTEAWLQSQKPSASVARHKNPPEDVLEAWIEKRVSKAVKRRGPGA